MTNNDSPQKTTRSLKSFVLPTRVEISYISPVRKKKIKVLSSRDAFKIFQDIYDDTKIDHKEMFCVLLLNRANFCIGFSFVGVGSTSGVVVNIQEIMQLAILTNSSSIILCHNHPSGNLNPSNLDVQVTEKINKACNLVDVKLLDHLIITSLGYYSMSEENLF